MRVLLLYDKPLQPPPIVSDAGAHINGKELEYAKVKRSKNVTGALKKSGYDCSPVALGHNLYDVIDLIESFDPSVIFNLCEDVMGRSNLEMNLPALLEMLGVPYTGSPPLTLGVCLNKAMTKAILAQNNIPTTPWMVLGSPEDDPEGLDFPLFVKPLHEDASIGINRKSVVSDESELRDRINHITTEFHQPAIVESYMEGREFNVSLLGNDNPTVLPISEIIFDLPRGMPKIVDFRAKWYPGSVEYRGTTPVCPARIDRDVEKEIKTIAVKAYKILGLRVTEEWMCAWMRKKTPAY